MSTVNKPLKYRFKVIYKDGLAFDQPDHDRSATWRVCNSCQSHVRLVDCNQVCPLCESEDLHVKSAFADVILDQVAVFMIIRVSDGYTVEVNLENGLFAFGGQVVQLHPQNHVFTTPLKLIFFREVRQTQLIQSTVQPDMTLKRDVLNEDVSVTKYFVGWETAGEGKLQRVVGIE